MGNMSYCRMENTYSDLYDCYENIDDVTSESEKLYRQKLIKLCKKMVDACYDENGLLDEYAGKKT